PKTWRYEQFEEMFFKFSGKLNLEDIFKKNEQSKVIQKEITALTAKQNKKKEKVAEILEQIETMEFSKSLYALISKLESETEELETKIKQKYQELSSVKQEELDRRIKDFKDINSLLLQSTEVETREKINNHLRGLIESIALDFKSKTCTIRFKNGIERHIHNDGMFASIPPKAEGEQREKDLDAILNWHNKTEAERQAIYEDADFKIVPLPVSAE
ncbi:TPA: hypothetical protein L4851_006229, partial [Pseudomonas aeruginosa]|nr:hypothetical protein [Pseudomonas aeruginosa]